MVLGRWHCPETTQQADNDTFIPALPASLLLPLLVLCLHTHTFFPQNQGPAIVSWITQCQVSEASSKLMCFLPDCMFGCYQQCLRNKILTEEEILVVRRPGGRKVSGQQCHSGDPRPQTTVGVPCPIVLWAWPLKRTQPPLTPWDGEVPRETSSLWPPRNSWIRQKS